MVCLFIPLTLSFAEQMFLILMKSSLLILSIVDQDFGVLSKISTPYPRSYKFSSMLSSRNFIVLCVHLGLLFILSYFVKSVSSVFGLIVVFFFFFACGCPVVPAPFVEKTIFSTVYCLCSFIKDQLSLIIWVCFWVLCSVS